MAENMQTSTVEELMLPLTDYTSVSQDAMLYDAFIALEGALQGVQKADQSHPRDFAVLVLDDNGEVLGRLVVWDILAGLEPQTIQPVDPLAMVEDYSAWRKPLANLATKARNIKVRDLVQALRKEEYIDIATTVDQALDRMIRHRLLSLIVTRDGKPAGILRVVDVFGKVCEAVKQTAATT